MKKLKLSGQMRTIVDLPLESFREVLVQKENELIDHIRGIMEKQKFNDWYNKGDWDRYISGDGVSKEEITEQIRKMFFERKE